ncbi:uncharacterized protein LOC141684904 [Apium graveolens]|uniref:uncharacterized protein LOC141684904 n=1 Tax=Apium graveolens TaxID=4045 RepID=UPI003D792334
MFSDVHGDTISDVINIELGGGYRSKFKYCPRTCKIYGLRRFFGKYDIDENFVIFFKYLGNSTFAITVFDYQCMNHFRDIEKYFRFEDFMYPPVNDVVIIISDDENILQENNEMEMMIQAEGDDDVEEDHDALVPDQDNTLRVRLLLSLVDQRGHGVYIPRWMRTFYAKWGRRTTVFLSVGETLWNVDVRKMKKCCRFAKGWDKFTRDNNLTIGQILTFQYIGNFTFAVFV